MLFKYPKSKMTKSFSSTHTSNENNIEKEIQYSTTQEDEKVPSNKRPVNLTIACCSIFKVDSSSKKPKGTLVVLRNLKCYLRYHFIYFCFLFF